MATTPEPLRVFREESSGEAGTTFDRLYAYATQFCCWGAEGMGVGDLCDACQELRFIAMSTEGMR